MIKNVFILLAFMFPSILLPHGFCKNTYVVLVDNKYQAIENLCRQELQKKQSACIVTYDQNKRLLSNQKIRSIATSVSNCYFEIGFDRPDSVDIICTPDQEFYVPLQQQWLPAYQLIIGDLLRTKNNDCVAITSINFVNKPLDVFIIELEQTHTFFVSKHAILTHNLILPFQLCAGISIPFGAAAIGTVGSFFGPITLIGGIVASGLVGVMIKLLREDKLPGYKLSHYDITAIDEYRKTIQQQDKAPGKPTAEDGYEPPKRWDGKKVKHPRTGNIGWPDKNGNIWVPSGPRGHGGPHWDVQDPKGGYRNILPGGRER